MYDRYNSCELMRMVLIEARRPRCCATALGQSRPGRKGAAYAYDMETLRYEVELEIRRYDLILLVVD